MAWKPRIAVAGDVPERGVKPWVAIAEDAAPTAVKLFVSIMNNSRYPIKVRMEAATRLVMIAGATFRGEKYDAQGRPAANLPGKNVARLESNALREVLRKLPEGTAVVNPNSVHPGERVVVIHDGNHSQKPTGHILEAVVGKMLEKTDDGTVVDDKLREEEVKDFKDKGENYDPPPPQGPALDLLASIFKGAK